ncbi:MAG: histidinol-phosphate transaminase [Pseudomonadota bacterium]
MSILNRARPEIRGLAPYASARAMAGLAPVTLNANESPWASLADAGGHLNRYPDPQPAELVAGLAGYFGVAPEHLIATRGSDEAIDLLIRAFCPAGASAIVQCPPTFGMYGISARVQGAQVIGVPLVASQDHAVDFGSVLEAASSPEVRLVFLCRPNNPTGSMVEAEPILGLCRALSTHALVVVDEAYMDFCAAPSLATEIGKVPNLAILRTLSKAHALAGARCGCLLADTPVIDLLKKILAPYPLPQPTVASVLAALQPEALAATEQQISMILRFRESLHKQLEKIDFIEKIWPSEGNFLLLRVTDGPGLCQWLAEGGVLLRNFNSTPTLQNCVRLTVGSPPENARVLALLEAYPG